MIQTIPNQSYATSFQPSSFPKVAIEKLKAKKGTAIGSIAIDLITSGIGPQDEVDNDLIHGLIATGQEFAKRGIGFSCRIAVIGISPTQIAMRGIAAGAFFRTKGQETNSDEIIRISCDTTSDDIHRTISNIRKLRQAYENDSIHGHIDTRFSNTYPLIGSEAIGITEEITEQSFETTWLVASHYYGIPNYLGVTRQTDETEKIQAGINFENIWNDSRPISFGDFPTIQELRAQVRNEVQNF